MGRCPQAENHEEANLEGSCCCQGEGPILTERASEGKRNTCTLLSSLLLEPLLIKPNRWPAEKGGVCSVSAPVSQSGERRGDLEPKDNCLATGTMLTVKRVNELINECMDDTDH